MNFDPTESPAKAVRLAIPLLGSGLIRIEFLAGIDAVITIGNTQSESTCPQRLSKAWQTFCEYRLGPTSLRGVVLAAGIFVSGRDVGEVDRQCWPSRGNDR